MSELGPRARAIVEAGRNADAPSAGDHHRIKRGVLFQIAASSALVSTVAAGAVPLGTKVGLAVLALTVVGGGAVGLHHLGSAKHPPAVHRQVVHEAAAVAPAPEHSVTEAPAATAREETARKPERVRRPAPPVARPAPTVHDDQLTAEVAVLKRAREELRLGRPAAALAALAEYDRRFGQGVLGEERQAIAAIAGCQASPGPAATAQGEAFLRKAPRSPLGDRMREACITAAARRAP